MRLNHGQTLYDSANPERHLRAGIAKEAIHNARWTPGMAGFARGMAYDAADFLVGMKPINPGRGQMGWQWGGIGLGKGGHLNGVRSNFWKGTGHYGWVGAKNWTGGELAAQGLKRFGGSLFFGGLSAGFVAHGAYKGWQENGLIGAVGGAAGEVGTLVQGLGVYQGVGRVMRGTWTSMKSAAGSYQTAIKYGGLGRGGFGRATWAASKTMGMQAGRIAGRVALSPIIYPAVAWMVGLSKIQQEASAALERYAQHSQTGNVGSLAAFQTQGAWSSRQMSVQAIQRSHMNARSALGNEAAHMHRRGF